MKKIIRVAAIFSILFNILSVTGFANSAPQTWLGRTVENVVIVGNDCPLMVEKEVLTFDIDSYPPLGARLEDMAGYTASVTAEYTFYNPADYDVTATLVFPFGKMPYGNYSEQKIICPDKDRYSVYLDGEEIKNRVKYTYSPGKKFDIYREMEKLTDGYIEDDFYSPDAVVKKYVYRATGYGEDKSPVRDVGMEWMNENGETVLLSKHYSNYYTKDKNTAVITVEARENENIVFYTIGKAVEKMPEMKVYSQQAGDENIKISLVETDEMTFKQFILNEWCPYDEATDISQEEWYNFFVTGFKEDINPDVMILGNYNYIEEMAEDIMGWFVYEITVPAGGRAVNAVVAPVYPAIDAEYEPTVYTYKYLLSPAQMWAEFKEIEIYINTDSYITYNSLAHFQNGENGYWYKSKGLPKGELRFSLCSDENPSHSTMAMPVKFSKKSQVVVIGVIVLAVAGFIYKEKGKNRID